MPEEVKKPEAKPEWKDHVSSNVRRTLYDPSAKIMHVQFMHGDAIYFYPGCEVEVADAIFKEPSIGHAISEFKKGRTFLKMTACSETKDGMPCFKPGCIWCQINTPKPQNAAEALPNTPEKGSV